MSEPGVLTYRASYFKFIFMSAVFAGMGWLGWKGVSHGAVSGWWILVLGAIGVFAGVLQLIPGSTYLRLSPEGLTVCQTFRKTFLPWEDLQEFGIVDLGRFQRGVGYRLVESKRNTAQTNRIARGLMNFDGALLPNYEIHYRALCDVLNDHLERLKNTGHGEIEITRRKEAEDADRSDGEKIRKKYSLAMAGFLAIVLVVFWWVFYHLKPKKTATIPAPVQEEKRVEEKKSQPTPEPPPKTAWEKEVVQDAEEANAAPPQVQLAPVAPLAQVHLKNGRVMSCHILNKDANGVSVEIDGAEVYFSNGEIETIG